MIYLSPPTDTVYFTVPADTYASNATSYIALDRNPTEETSLKTMEYKTESSPLKQARVDGINFKDTRIAFKVCCTTYAELNLIDTYFEARKGTLSISIINGLTGGITQDFIITDWNISLQNSIYGDIQAQGELVYP